MQHKIRPGVVWIFVIAMAAGAFLTGYFGLSANGYLVPALTLLMMAVFLWLGKLGKVIKAITLTNLASGSLLVLVLAGGEFLGDHKLDVSGAALLVNLLCGGPLLSLIAPALLLGLRSGTSLTRWFNAAPLAA